MDDLRAEGAPGEYVQQMFDVAIETNYYASASSDEQTHLITALAEPERKMPKGSDSL